MKHQQQTAFENIVGKGEIARYEQFLLFPQCVQLNQIMVCKFDHIFDIISTFAVEVEEPRSGISREGLRPCKTNYLCKDLSKSICPLTRSQFNNFSKGKDAIHNYYKI